MSKTGPTINKGHSKQDYETPADFMEEVVRRFGDISWDLAASESNAKAKVFFSEKSNSLAQPWRMLAGNLWLNPPFADIEPWAAKCAESVSRNNRILFLVPASVGSVWYQKWVEPYAYVLALNPRLKFVGAKDAYPKDLILAVYNAGLTGFKTWRWK